MVVDVVGDLVAILRDVTLRWGACSGSGDTGFFPGVGGQGMAEMRRVVDEWCRACEVTAECREYARLCGIRDGVWGGGPMRAEPWL